ncbi:MAG: hypothetical protein ACHQ3P_11915, partial [Candidatus Limnocylindrales bacterium]
AVTGLQSARSATLDASAVPAIRAVDELSSLHTELEQRVAALRDAYNASAGTYAESAARIAAYEVAMGQLARTVNGITGSAQSLPATVRLPSVPRAAAGRAPAVHACTTASGRPC